MKRTCLCPLILLFSNFLFASSNPVPLIYQPLIPPSVAPGSRSFTLTVHGTGFVRDAVIKANGQALKTTFVNSTTLTGQVPASGVAKAGTAAITVANPGSIASNVVYFSVHDAVDVQLNRDNTVINGGSALTADFNNDNRPDIFTFGFDGTQGNGILTTYFSRGTGQFLKALGAQFPFGDQLWPGDVAADFNNDGYMDVSVCTYTFEYSCSVYLGNGKGRFTPINSGATEPVADLNGDGILDTVGVSTDFTNYEMCVNLGNGDGTFRTGLCTPMNIAALSIAAVGDFNGDGKLDVAVAGSGFDNNYYVGIFLGNGDGTLQSDVDYRLPIYANNLAVADVNGDGKLDLITNSVTVLLGNGDGTFNVGSTINLVPTSGSTFNNVKVADFNDDGILDVATVTLDANQNQILNVLIGNGDGTFLNPAQFAVQPGGIVGPEQDLGIADFNNDGLIDFVVGGNTSSTVLLQVFQP